MCDHEQVPGDRALRLRAHSAPKERNPALGREGAQIRSGWPSQAAVQKCVCGGPGERIAAGVTQGESESVFVVAEI